LCCKFQEKLAKCGTKDDLHELLDGQIIIKASDRNAEAQSDGQEAHHNTPHGFFALSVT
jgi:hypothetical protein